MPNRFELDQLREAAETYTPSSAITVQAIGSGETGSQSMMRRAQKEFAEVYEWTCLFCSSWSEESRTSNKNSRSSFSCLGSSGSLDSFSAESSSSMNFGMSFGEVPDIGLYSITPSRNSLEPMIIVRPIVLHRFTLSSRSLMMYF